MNVRLLRKIQKHILAEPRRLDMDRVLVKGRRVAAEYGEDAPACGTVGCIAGWAIQLTEPTAISTNRVAKAQDVLSLTDDEAGRLFFLPWHGWANEGWPDSFANRFGDARGATERAQITAERIDHFIETKGAE